MREYIECTTNSAPPRGWGVLLKCTFLRPGVPRGIHLAPHPRCRCTGVGVHTRSTLVKVVHEEYTLHHTHTAGVLELAYTRIKLYTRARSGYPSVFMFWTKNRLFFSQDGGKKWSKTIWRYLHLAIWNEVCRSKRGSAIQWDRMGTYQSYPARSFVVPMPEWMPPPQCKSELLECLFVLKWCNKFKFFGP